MVDFALLARVLDLDTTLNIRTKKTMKFFICLFSCSFLLLNSCFAHADESKILTKQQVWNQFFAEVNEWVDGIGYPIDAKIKETLVALNVLGLSTSASCEGHLDHGNPQMKPLHLLLNQFYQQQNSSYDCMLILSANGRLQSIGGEWQVMRSSEEKITKLREYQEEMEKFTRFLKIRFFGHLE